MTFLIGISKAVSEHSHSLNGCLSHCQVLLGMFAEECSRYAKGHPAQQ